MGALLRHLQDAMGQSGAPVAAVAGVAATGTITITAYGSIQAADTVTVGDTTLAWVESDPGEGEVEIGSDNGATRDNLLAALQEVADAEGVVVASSSTAAISVTAAVKGVAGNSIDLVKSGDGVTVSGSGTLANGVDQVKGTAAPAGSIRVDGTTSKAYIAVKDTTETDTSGWKEITVS